MKSEEKIFYNDSFRFTGEIPSGKIAWRSPSNIALVKYWGKKPVQLPMNPSVSFTLSKAFTETVMSYFPSNAKNGTLRFFFDGIRNELFERKTKTYFEALLPIFPFIKQLDFEIHSKNSFPHSAGIASSASGMSALALCLCDLERKYFSTLSNDKSFWQKASYIARLGSGSACRSVYGGCVVWGADSAMVNSSDLFGIPFTTIHPIFQTYRNTILIVDANSKKVSSRAGHALMETNPFAEARFAQARKNLTTILNALTIGDTETFVSTTEAEALTLHAMMMTSKPYYMLFKPATIAIIEKLFAFRNSTGLPVSFTLDAGPNVHILYPESIKMQVVEFVKSELTGFLKEGFFIEDGVGKGPERIVV